MVPRYENIPLELRSLAEQHVAALRQFDIDSGQYECMKYGYRKKTGILRLSCSKDPVEHKIALLPSVEDRAICTTALNFLLSTSSSSYEKFYDMPNLYPFTTWCDTIHDGSSDRKSSKISFITKCLSEVIDYSLHFNLLPFQCDRWLYKTITGAIHSSPLSTTKPVSAFQALQDKPFPKGYWDF